MKVSIYKGYRYIYISVR